MESILVRLMIIAALGKFGFAAIEAGMPMSKHYIANIEKKSRDILRIEWKPISVFPEEAKRFRSAARRKH